MADSSVELNGPAVDALRERHSIGDEIIVRVVTLHSSGGRVYANFVDRSNKKYYRSVPQLKSGKHERILSDKKFQALLDAEGAAGAAGAGAQP